MIRFDTVTKHYRGAPRAALDAVDLEIGAGEFVFLVGASGSGKSSLLRLMLREERPSSGEIHVLGQRLTTISTRKVPYFRRSLGVVFQDFRLLPNKTVHDNVAFTLQVIGKSRGFIQTTVPDVLETVGLAEKAQNYPNELSGGEQQRVAIARAVVNKPAILLADEPTGNLDPTTSDGIMAVLERINQAGTTVVMATHDVTIVDRLQKRVVELVGGRIIRDELEASYVTSSIPLPRRAPQPQAEPQIAGPEVPLWARRGGQAEQGRAAEAPQSPAEPERPAAAASAPRESAWLAGLPPRPAAVPAAARAADPGMRIPAAAEPPHEPRGLDLAPATADVPSAAPLDTASLEPDGDDAAQTTGRFVLPPRPASAPANAAEPSDVSETSTGPLRARPTTGSTPVPAAAAPIWFRSDTGPVLVPGEHAPWRAAPVAPPVKADGSGESRAIFFAPPVSATPSAPTPVQPPAVTPPAPVAVVPAAPAAPVRRPAPVDVDDTGDAEGQLRRLGRHRTMPLPDHLDFVTGLGLRPAGRDADEVGPSS